MMFRFIQFLSFPLLVNPNATDEEVREVVNGNRDVQIFAQAAMGNRYANAQGVYREVQERGEAVRKIEQTMAELAQLFQDVRELLPAPNSTYAD